MKFLHFIRAITEDSDGYVYHIAPLQNLEGIANDGLDPAIGSGNKFGGAFGVHSQNRNFVASGQAAAAKWFDKVATALEAASDEPMEQTAVVLRAPANVAHFEVDQEGSRDVHSADDKPSSLYTTDHIDSEHLEVWHPQHGWFPLEGYYHDDEQMPAAGPDDDWMRDEDMYNPFRKD